MEQMTWTPAAVGCYWSCGEWWIGTYWNGGAGTANSGYQLNRNREEIGRYATLLEAQVAAQSDASANTPLGTPESEAKLYAAIMGDDEAKFTKDDIDCVRELNGWLEDPPSVPDDAVPEVSRLLSAAWWITEDFIRRETGKCSSAHTRKDEHAPELQAPFTCQCCRYFHEIGARARRLRNLL